MPRRPLGDRPMTTTERTRLHRQRQEARVDRLTRALSEIAAALSARQITRAREIAEAALREI